MALETLKDVQLNKHIKVDHKQETITFRIQKGPVKDKGVNGCQVDALVEVAQLIIKGLNEKVPCGSNSDVLTYLNLALQSLAARIADRKKRGVEGTNAA